MTLFDVFEDNEGNPRDFLSRNLLQDFTNVTNDIILGNGKEFLYAIISEGNEPHIEESVVN